MSSQFVSARVKGLCCPETLIIKMYLSGPLRPHKLLVFINPYGGKKKGRKIYHSVVAPLFELAGISSHVIGKHDLIPHLAVL